MKLIRYSPQRFTPHELATGHITMGTEATTFTLGVGHDADGGLYEATMTREEAWDLVQRAVQFLGETEVPDRPVMVPYFHEHMDDWERELKALDAALDAWRASYGASAAGPTHDAGDRTDQLGGSAGRLDAAAPAHASQRHPM